MSGIDIGQVIGDYNDHLSAVLPKAVGSNLAIWSLGSIATVLLFNILRPRNKIIYEPKVKYHVGDKAPPPVSDGFFSWVKPLWSTKEEVLLDKVGLDAVTFLRFLRMMSWIFLFVSVLTCGALIPANVVYNLKNVEAGKRNTLSQLTIQNVQGGTLFIHVAASYLINAFMLGIIFINWRSVIKLRYMWFRSDEYTKSFYARTLMILSVPKKLQSDEGLQNLLSGLQIPYPATSVHIGRRVGQLPELIEYHNETVRSFEQVLVQYLKGGKIGKKRPTITIGGFLGFGGEKKDAIEFYTRKLARTEAAVQEWREKSEFNKVENYGFASMAAVPYAHIVAQRLSGKHPKGTTITLAPNPKDIIWKNLTMTDAKRRSQQMMGWLWLSVVCFFNTIPLLFISLVANLSHVAQYVPFLDKWQTQSEWTFALVNGILPPTVSAIFGYFLPKIMRWLSRYQGAITHSRLDRAVVARYFAFLIISQLVIFSLLGVGFQLITQIVNDAQQQKSVWEILKSTKELPGQIQSTYISQAPYWLTFFPLRGFLAVFDLAQLLNVVWIWIKTRMFGRTPRDIREWTQPPSFEFSVYYSNLLFMAAVGLVYAPLAPLVALGAAVVFWISVLVYKYQIMFVFVSKVESGGRLWNPIVNRLLVSLVLMQLLMTLTIGLTHGWKSFYWVSCIPPIFAVLACKIWWTRTFMNQFRFYIPSDQEIANATVYSERADNKNNRLEKRFGHPALHAELFTPMLHKKMMPLLAEVYHGRLGNDSATLGEYGGQKLQAQIAPGGIKIAAVDEQHLEMDPALYQRDRGELDWDQRSVAATTIMGGGTKHGHGQSHHQKEGYYSSHGATRNTAYDQYMQQPQRIGTPSNGLGVANYEMSRLGSEANLPLLATQSNMSLGHSSSQHSLHERSPSVGPNAAYGSTPMNYNNPSGYFEHARQPSTGFEQAVANAGSPYHSRPGSAGFDQTVARSGSPYQRPGSAGFDQTVARSGSPYQRPGSAGFDQTVARSGSPYHGRQNSSGFDQAVANASAYPPPRSGSGMGYYQQQSPAQAYPSGPSPNQYQTPSPSQYHAPSPSQYQAPSPQRGNEGNMAGRGAFRRDY